MSSSAIQKARVGRLNGRSKNVGHFAHLNDSSELVRLLSAERHAKE
jgi:hypothetical protein